MHEYQLGRPGGIVLGQGVPTYSIGDAAMPKPESPVVQSLRELEAAQSMVSVTIDALFDRLAPVLSPTPPMNECGKAERPSSCPVESVLMARIADEHRVQRALSQLLERLAV